MRRRVDANRSLSPSGLAGFLAVAMRSTPVEVGGKDAGFATMSYKHYVIVNVFDKATGEDIAKFNISVEEAT